MKRLISALLILMLVLSMFTISSMLVFAEGEGEGSTENEETLPEGGDTGSDSEAEDKEEKDPGFLESEEMQELTGLVGEIKTILGEVKNEFVGVFNEVKAFIASNETYKNIFTAILACLAIVFLPFLVAIMVLGYIAIAVIVLISSALMSVVEFVVGWFVGVAFIV